MLPGFICFLLGSFHLYRVCCGVDPSRTKTRTIRQRSGDLTVITAQSDESIDDISPYYWTPLGILAVVFSIYMFVHAVSYTIGYWYSCKEYRHEIVRLTQATGAMVQVIQGRISCNAVFDFLDYLHPDVSYEKRRIDRINTPFALGLPLIATWFSFVGWIAVAIIAFSRARATRDVRV